MGQFSWMYADKENKESLLIGEKAYIPCPDGSVIQEHFYDGYGRFGGNDIFELVAEWNKNTLSIEQFQAPFRNDFNRSKIEDFKSGKDEEYMEKTYGPIWKREIGIMIACDNEQNNALMFPIKVCKEKPVSYNLIPASLSDPNQGRLPASFSYIKPSLDSRLMDAKNKQVESSTKEQNKIDKDIER